MLPEIRSSAIDGCNIMVHMMTYFIVWYWFVLLPVVAVDAESGTGGEGGWAG